MVCVWGGKALGDGARRMSVLARDANARPSRHPHKAASANYRIQRRDTPDQIRAADTTSSRNLPHLFDSGY